MKKSTIIVPGTGQRWDGFCGAIRELIKPYNSDASLMSCVIVTLEPGERAAKHWHANCEEIYFVLSGFGRMYLDDRIEMISPEYTVHIPPGVKHNVENDSTQPLRLLVVNAPPFTPEDVIFEENDE